MKIATKYLWLIGLFNSFFLDEMNKSPKKLLVTIPQMINFFWTYSLHKKRLFFPLLFLRIVVPFLSLLPAFYYKELVDTIANFTGSNSLDLLPQLTSIVLIIGVIQLFRIILFRIADFLNITLAVEVVQKMYQDAFDYIHHHAYQFFTNVFSGALVRQIGKLTNAYETLMDLLFFSIFPMLISSLFIIIVSSSYSIYFGIILLGWLVVFSLVQYRLYKRNYPYEIKVNAADSECSGNFADTLTNYFNIKIFASIQREAFHFAKKLDHRAQLSKTRNYRKTLIHAVSALSIFVCEIGILYLTIRLWGAGLLSIGVFVLLQTYMFKLFDEFATLGHVFRVLFRAF